MRCPGLPVAQMGCAESQGFARHQRQLHPAVTPWSKGCQEESQPHCPAVPPGVWGSQLVMLRMAGLTDLLLIGYCKAKCWSLVWSLISTLTIYLQRFIMENFGMALPEGLPFKVRNGNCRKNRQVQTRRKICWGNYFSHFCPSPTWGQQALGVGRWAKGENTLTPHAGFYLFNPFLGCHLSKKEAYVGLFYAM